MTDPLDNIQKRLGWINRGLIVGAAVIVVALIVFAVHRMRAGTAPAPAASGASAALHPAPAASVPALAASAAAKLASAPAAAASAAPARAASGASQPAAGSQLAQAARSAQAAASSAAAPAPVLPQVQPGVAPQGAASAAPGASAAAMPGAPAALPAPHARAARRPEHHAARRERSSPHGAASAVCSRAGWYVQVGAFAELKSYEQLRARLERFHLPNCRGAHSPHGLHVLLVGPYATRAEAQRLRSHLKEPLRKASYLRHLGSK